MRKLEISVSGNAHNVVVRFEDSGSGIPAPNACSNLQEGAFGAGMGLYVSRVIVRSYGGDLRFEPVQAGSRFAVELQAV